MATCAHILNPLSPDCPCHLQILVYHLKDDNWSRCMKEALVIPFWSCAIAPVQLLCLQSLLHPLHIVQLHVLQLCANYLQTD